MKIKNSVRVKNKFLKLLKYIGEGIIEITPSTNNSTNKNSTVSVSKCTLSVIHRIEVYISKLEKNITLMSEIDKLNNIITENECILKSELSLRYGNLSGKIYFISIINILFIYRSCNEKSHVW